MLINDTLKFFAVDRIRMYSTTKLRPHVNFLENPSFLIWKILFPQILKNNLHPMTSFFVT